MPPPVTHVHLEPVLVELVFATSCGGRRDVAANAARTNGYLASQMLPAF